MQTPCKPEDPDEAQNVATLVSSPFVSEGGKGEGEGE